jgi:cell division septation protein DedD
MLGGGFLSFVLILGLISPSIQSNQKESKQASYSPGDGTYDMDAQMRDEERARGELPPQPAAAPKAQPAVNQKDQIAALLRVYECRELQDALTQEGYDVDVKVSDSALTTLVMIGPGVSHLFIRQLLADPEGRRGIKKAGFMRVNFMHDDYTVVGVYYPLTEKLAMR